MTTQELKKIAIKYGVPMPETCKDLKLEIITAFYWVEIEKDVFVLKTKAIDGFNNFSHVQPMNEAVRTIYAPQMHEIAPLLPHDIFDEKYEFFQYKHIVGYKYLEEYNVRIENNHYAEAYAKIYLKLKGEGLL